MSTLLIYGATGYTGRMAAERAKALGLKFEIAGRNRQRLAGFAAQLDVPYRQVAALFDIQKSDIIGEWERRYDEGGLEALSRQP